VISLGNRAFLPPSSRGSSPHDLVPAAGHQDHTISPSASVTFVCAENPRASPTRPPQPRLTSRDDRDAPLLMRRDGDRQSYFSEKWKWNILPQPPGRQIGLHRVVNVRFFAQAISFIVKRRARRNGPDGRSTLARRANHGRATAGVRRFFSTARTIARLATIDTVGACQAGYGVDATYIVKRVPAARVHPAEAFCGGRECHQSMSMC
jgi:hypothetical protein